MGHRANSTQETHRRSLENLDEMFYNKIPTRKFKSMDTTISSLSFPFFCLSHLTNVLVSRIGYQCTGVVQQHEENEKALAVETDSGTASQLQKRPSRET